MLLRLNMFLTLQRQFLFIIINQQLFCYGLTTTTTTAPMPTTARNLSSSPIISSSSSLTPATVPLSMPIPLNASTPSSTIKTYGKYLNNVSAAGVVGGKNCVQKKNCYKIIAIEANCTRDYFEMHLHLNSAFRGVLYAKDFPLECRARGNGQTNITLRLPTSGCGVRVDPRPGNAGGSQMEFSVRVMLQTEQKLRQSSDIMRNVRCKLPMAAMGMTVLPAGFSNSNTKLKASMHGGVVGVGSGKLKYNHRNGRMRTFATSTNNANNASSNGSNAKHDNTTIDIAPIATNHADTGDTNGGDKTTNSLDTVKTTQATTTTTTPALNDSSINKVATTTTTTPRVRIWLELGGDGDGSGSVELGEPTQLTVRAIVPGYMGVRVVDCAALDGLGESTQQLLDERGCPIDEQVMPALHTRFKPAEEGWSKMHEDDLVEKTFAATFPAFKFPDRERLHVSCGVQLCKGKCPNVNCRSVDEKLNLSGDNHLARIEVFNSLAVTAPQIEVDRLTYDRRYNWSEEYPPYVRHLPSEGTLCLSVSKLAIAFCTLGLIFLIAVIVAIYSLLRSRQRGFTNGTRRCCVAASLVGAGSGGENTVNRFQRTELCTSMFSSSSDSAQSARFSSKLFMPYYPNTLPYGRVY